MLQDMQVACFCYPFFRTLNWRFKSVTDSLSLSAAYSETMATLEDYTVL